MAEYTPNLNLVKPAQEDFYDVDDHNHNYDILDEEIPKKVDKVEGKQLSTEDYTSEEKAKLAGIDPQANKYVHPSTHSADILVDGATNKTVTAEEKNAWNAKETPDGAQAKATAAGAAALAAANDYTDQEVGALAGEGNNKTVKEIADAQASHLAESATDAHKISNITGLQTALNGRVKAGTANTDVQELITFLLPTDTRSWIPTTFDATTPTKPTHIDIKDGATVVATLDMTWDADGNITQLEASDGTTTVTYTISWTDGVWQGTTKAVV